MIPWVNLFLWSLFFGILAFFTYHELQETSRDFTESQIIPGEREDVFKILLDPEKLANFHSLLIGIKDIQKVYDDDDSEAVTEIRYTAYEKLSFLGYFERVNTLRVTFFVIEPNSLIRFYVNAEGLVQLSGNYTLADYKGQDGPGTVLVDRVTITSHRALVNIALGEAITVHRTLLKKLRLHFLEQISHK